MQQPDVLRKTPFNPLRDLCPIYVFPRREYDSVTTRRQHLWCMLHSDASPILQEGIHNKTLKEEPLDSKPTRELDSMHRHSNWNPRCIHEH